MKLRLASDLHLEFDRRKKSKIDFMNFLDNDLLPILPDDKDTVLLIPGDIDSFKMINVAYESFSARFKAVIAVLGNHEYYDGNLPTVHKKIVDRVASLNNVHVLQCETVTIDDVHFVGATLWTDMDKMNQLLMYDVKNNMSDYKYIRTGPAHIPWKKKLAPVDTVYLHNIHRDYIFDTVRKLKTASNKKVVVLSHHLPSYLCISDNYKERYKAANLNGAYASELFDQIADAKPDLWVHGHTHEKVDVMVADTRTLCNPRGYFGVELNEHFNPTFTAEI